MMHQCISAFKRGLQNVEDFKFVDDTDWLYRTIIVTDHESSSAQCKVQPTQQPREDKNVQD